MNKERVVAVGIVTLFGLIMLSLGLLFIVLFKQEEVRQLSFYNTSTLTFSHYETVQQACRICSVGCVVVPYVSHVVLSYHVFPNETRYLRRGQSCGAIPSEAEANLRRDFGFIANTTILYQISNPSFICNSIAPNEYVMGIAVPFIFLFITLLFILPYVWQYTDPNNCD